MSSKLQAFWNYLNVDGPNNWAELNWLQAQVSNLVPATPCDTTLWGVRFVKHSGCWSDTAAIMQAQWGGQQSRSGCSYVPTTQPLPQRRKQRWRHLRAICTNQMGREALEGLRVFPAASRKINKQIIYHPITQLSIYGYALYWWPELLKENKTKHHDWADAPECSFSRY